jgi:isopenicillin N synthase-like dioxygenase
MQSAGDFSTIPLVDISPLIAGDAAGSRATAEALGKAARQVGFVYVTGHGIPQPLFDGLLNAATRFFDQPATKKMEVYIGQSANHRGYVPAGEEVFAVGTKDTKEAFDLSIDLPPDDPAIRAGTRLLGPNQWPDLPDFKSAVTAYYDAVFTVGRALIRGFAMALGEAPDFFDSYITTPPSQLRLIHYPFNPDATDAIGIGAHSDYECFTLLHSTSPGLEVMNGAGQWIDAPPVPGALTINIGDLMELWTNGEFTATSHRVRRVQEERYSFPLFFMVDYGTKIAPLDRFQQREGPRRQGLIAGDHLFAQTAQSFCYLVERMKSGQLTLPDGAHALSSFGQEARTRTDP